MGSATSPVSASSPLSAGLKVRSAACRTFMHQAAAQGKYVAAVADAMLVPAPSRNEVSRVARMAEDLIDTTAALLSVLRGRMRKAPGGES